MKEVLMWFTLLALLTAAGCAQDTTRQPLTSVQSSEPSQAAPVEVRIETRPLFIIERSKNANTVHYDARLADGQLDPKEPVIAYYIMLAEDGRRQELNPIEKAMAYGFAIKPDSSGRGYRMTLVAAPQQSILVKQEGSAVRAEVVIAGQPAVLEKMYISASDGSPWPQVLYIELYGKDLRTGEQRIERISPQ